MLVEIYQFHTSKYDFLKLVKEFEMQVRLLRRKKFIFIEVIQPCTSWDVRVQTKGKTVQDTGIASLQEATSFCLAGDPKDMCCYEVKVFFF